MALLPATTCGAHELHMSSRTSRVTSSALVATLAEFAGPGAAPPTAGAVAGAPHAASSVVRTNAARRRTEVIVRWTVLRVTFDAVRVAAHRATA